MLRFRHVSLDGGRRAVQPRRIRRLLLLHRVLPTQPGPSTPGWLARGPRPVLERAHPKTIRLHRSRQVHGSLAVFRVHRWVLASGFSQRSFRRHVEDVFAEAQAPAHAGHPWAGVRGVLDPASWQEALTPSGRFAYLSGSCSRYSDFAWGRIASEGDTFWIDIEWATPRYDWEMEEAGRFVWHDGRRFSIDKLQVYSWEERRRRRSPPTSLRGSFQRSCPSIGWIVWRRYSIGSLLTLPCGRPSHPCIRIHDGPCVASPDAESFIWARTRASCPACSCAARTATAHTPWSRRASTRQTANSSPRHPATSCAPAKSG